MMVPAFFLGFGLGAILLFLMILPERYKTLRELEDCQGKHTRG